MFVRNDPVIYLRSGREIGSWYLRWRTFGKGTLWLGWKQGTEVSKWLLLWFHKDGRERAFRRTRSLLRVDKCPRVQWATS